jgi:NADH dehydrogenase
MDSKARRREGECRRKRDFVNYQSRCCGRLTVVDRRNYHLFQPLLYQVATGSLSPGEIAAPLRSVLSRQRNTRVLLGEMEDLDPAGKRVVLADGASLEYDSLIIAVGSQTAYFGHDAWREWAPGLKSVEEAETIRHKILYAFEVAERIADPIRRQAWLTFVIVGAGPCFLLLSDPALSMTVVMPASARRRNRNGCESEGMSRSVSEAGSEVIQKGELHLCHSPDSALATSLR